MKQMDDDKSHFQELKAHVHRRRRSKANMNTTNVQGDTCSRDSCKSSSKAAVVTAEDLLSLGRKALFNDDHKRALECFNAFAAHTTTRSSSQSALLFASRAAALHGIGRAKDAEHAAELALQYQTLHIEGMWYRACALQMQGRLFEAIKAFEAFDLVHSQSSHHARSRVQMLRNQLGSIYHVATLNEPEQLESSLVSLSLDSDGSKVAWAFQNGRIFVCSHVIDSSLGMQVESETLGVQAECTCWTRASSLLAVGCTKGTLFVMHCSSCEEPILGDCYAIECFDRSSGTISIVEPLGETQVACGSSTGRITIVDAARAMQIDSLQGHHPYKVNALSADSLTRFLASAGNDGYARVWQLQWDGNKHIYPSKCMHEFKWGEAFVTDVALSSSGRYLITIMNNSQLDMHRLLLWSVSDGQICRWFDGHKSRINHLSWVECDIARCAGLVATCSNDGTVRSWRLNTEPIGAGRHEMLNDAYKGMWIHKPRRADTLNEGAIFDIKMHPVKPLLACAFRDGSIRILDTKAYYRCFVDFQMSTSGSVIQLLWVNTMERLVAAATDGAVKVFDIPSYTHCDQMAKIEEQPSE